VGALLKLSKLIDAVNEWIGKLTMWLVLAAVIISAGNATLRKAFNIGSSGTCSLPCSCSASAT
jgi:TRAP-type mannitol/chloroaromatic compound transport system permease small subunit